MSVEVQQVNDIEDNEINNDDDEVNENENENEDEDENEIEDDGDADDEFAPSKHNDIRDISPSPSRSASNSSTSLDMTGMTRQTRNKHPLSSSYKEWLNNWFSISIPAIGFLGCQLSLALQNGFVTPELEELGISEKIVNYAWLAPPLTG